MNKEEYAKNYRESVDFLKRNIAHEDIHDFAEQAIRAAEYFLDHWNKWEDVSAVCRENQVAHIYVSNILTIRKLKDASVIDSLNIQPNWLDE